MFTGLIEEIGSITSITDSGDGAVVEISAHTVLDDVSHGDSIAISGVCLTVIDSTPSSFRADVMKETLRHSAAGSWKPGTKINLERAARVGDRLGGHIVQGHVDATAEVLEVKPGDQWSVIRISLREDIAPLVAHKGSITVDGVSLTVSAVGRDWAEVSLIPETLAATTLGDATVGDVVNVETDVLARHVLRLREFVTDGVST
ncbi:MAG TPA: riboflavin synthase [Pontimonas sp.]|nr:riboflavin synthase [Pontimonas sp.]